MKKILLTLLIIFSICSSYLIYDIGKIFNNDQSISLLAGQFLKGHISLEPNVRLPAGDISIYQGKYYMYFGPLSSVFLMPFVFAFGVDFPQIVVGILSMAISFAGIFFISRFFKFSREDAVFLSVFFVFSTVVFSTSIINITSYLVESLACSMMVLSLMFYFSKSKKPFLSGLFLGFAIASRIVFVLAILFFIFEFLQKRLSKEEVIRLLSPVIFIILLLFFYNFMRFDSIFETGYGYHMGNPYPLSENFKFGGYGLIHIPANIYSFFIKPPLPILQDSHGFVFKFPYLKADPWGMAVWFTSPLFLMMLVNFRKNKFFLSSFLTTLIIMIPIFTFFSVGFAQFGYRYALDFLPFLFLLLIPCLNGRLSRLSLFLICSGVLFNCIYITSLWDVYPLFGIR